jgi:hypothetical protein
VRPDPVIAPMLIKLKDCMCEYLSNPATTPLGGGLCECCLVWSDRVFTDGCDCECTDGSRGRAYVRFVSARGRESQTRGAPGCPSGLEVTIELGIIRCYTPTEGVPDCEVLEAEALVALADLHALRRIVSCCNALPKRYTMDLAQPVGPQGGCIGGTMQLTFPTSW